MRSNNQSGDPYREIKELGSLLGNDEQRSGEKCPFCFGGHARELSLSIKRQNNEVVFNCHRNSCGIKGSVLMIFENEVVTNPKKKTTRKELIPRNIILPHLKPLDETQIKFIEDKFGFSREEITRNNWMWDNVTNRMWLPIKGISKLQIGFENKSFDEDVSPKSVLSQHKTEVPLVHFNVRYPGEDMIVVVEDMLSAAKAARRYNTASLMGTNFSQALVETLLVSKFHHIVLILDKDAYQKAQVYKKRYGELFHTFRIIQPPKDLKYMTDEEIRILVEGK